LKPAQAGADGEMRSSHIIIAIILLILIAGGGGAAYFFLASDAPPKIVEFIGRQQRVLADGDAVDAPHDGAAVIARLQKDMLIDSVGVVEGDKWVQVALPDKRTAYFPISSLGAKPTDTQTASLPATGTTGVAPQSSPTDQTLSAGQTAGPAPDQIQPAGTATSGQAGTTPPPLEETATVEFDEIASVYSVTKSTPVYIEPNTRAPQKYQIEPGTSVPAIQRSKDGVWVMASTEDGDPAFLLVSDLGPEQPGKVVAGAEADPNAAGGDPNAAPANGATADTVDGKATVVTTGDLKINGQDVILAGIAGEGSPYAEQLQKQIPGGPVHCIRQASGYQCRMSSGLDVGATALFNGWAHPTQDAPETYQSQAKAAQIAHRGVWR
jgi:hypothetical protein